MIADDAEVETYPDYVLLKSGDVTVKLPKGSSDSRQFVSAVDKMASFVAMQESDEVAARVNDMVEDLRSGLND